MARPLARGMRWGVPVADILGNTSTTATISVGGIVTNTLETIGDHDWFRITLAAGQSISVNLTSAGASALEDPYLYLRNSSGGLISENDDGGPGRDSLLNFTASTAGTYYIDVGAWEDGYAGGYQLSVTNYVPGTLPVYTNDQIASQLVSGYWGGDIHRFNVAQGGTLTVDLTQLTAAGQNLARNALAMWSDVIGVHFSEGGGAGADITFDDNEDGAASDGVWSSGIISSAHVNVSAQWLADYGSSLNSYSFQTYIHEIGHALGLGHAGDYNGDATYSTDAIYANDAWSTTVMSYFSPTENTYFANQGFSYDFLVSPMAADIVAMSRLYGLSTTTRAGNTTYGFNCTADRSVFDATKNNAIGSPVAYTIIDSGGIDTLDYSGFSASQLINLTAEAFSNVGGSTGNVCIARGTAIENAIGGSGFDTLLGNLLANVLMGNAGNDILNGGSGIDKLYGGSGNDTYVIDSGLDYAIERAGEGTDLVQSSLNHPLRADVENLTLTGGANVYGKGNALDNVLTGNGGANRLYGLGGNDKLAGNGGNDYLVGGAGSDTMTGGVGNDRYVVDGSDIITELAGQGADRVDSSVDWTLGANFERLDLLGTAALAGTGNELANIINGNSGANIIRGGGGNDKLFGLGGADSIDGGTGNDWIEGGAGRDSYHGGTGADRFVFRTGDFGGNSAATADVIQDFGDAEGDVVSLYLVDASTAAAGDQPFAFIGTSAFHHSAGELRYEQISGNTYVQGDTNGDGIADFWIRVDGLHTLASDDFIF